jgi:hypothetical protein
MNHRFALPVLALALVSNASAQTISVSPAQSRPVLTGTPPCPGSSSAVLADPLGASGDGFGSSLALTGSELFVGAPGDDATGADVGAVYVYRRRLGVWLLDAALYPGDLLPGRGFGASLAVDRGRLAVGGPGAVGGVSGAVYVFERVGGSWGEVARIEAAAAPDDAFFGQAVALEGERLVAGAPFADNFIGTFVGNAYVFERDLGGTWTQSAELFPSSAPNGAIFGSSVALSGGTILVGAPYVQVAFIPGSAFLFRRSRSGWSFTQKIAGGVSTGRDRFGSSVLLEGDRAWIGSPRDGIPLGLFDSYELQQGAFVSTATELSPEPMTLDRFGSSLARAGERLVVGASNHAGRGAAFLFEPGAPPCLLAASDGADLDQFGAVLAADGTTVAVGAPLSDGAGVEEGAVYVFDVP